MHVQLEMVIKMQDELGSFGVKKAFPFTKFLNYKLNKLRGSGVLQNTLTIPKQNCPLNENPMPITFHKMVFLFTVFVLGGILSIIIFIFERTISNKTILENNENGGMCNIDTLAIEQSQKKMKKWKRKQKIRHLTDQVRHLQRSLEILKTKNRNLIKKKWLMLQKGNPRVNSQLQQEPKLICRPSSI